MEKNLKNLSGLKKNTLIIIIMLVFLFPQNGKGQSKGEESLANSFYKIYKSKGVKAVKKSYNLLKLNDPDKVTSSMGQFNRLAYTISQKDSKIDGLEIFKLNAKLFPESWNVIDSLAEGYFGVGEYQKSKEQYERSLKLNPNNYNGFFQIKKIYNVLNYDKKEYKIPMRDGVKLFTQVYTPKDKSIKYPVLLNRTPYRNIPYGESPDSFKRRLGPNFKYPKEGFIFVFQDVRGRFMSEGIYREMRPARIHRKSKTESDESTDVFDTIEWLLENISNHNRKVGIYGFSYPGFYTVQGLVDAHPAIKAVNPKAPIVDWFLGDDFHRNGVFNLLKTFDFLRKWGHYGQIQTTNKKKPLFQYQKEDLYKLLLKYKNASQIGKKLLKGQVPFWTEIMEHSNYDKFWQSRNALTHLKKVDCAVFTVGGWFDTDNLYGALNTFQTVQRLNPDSLNYLIMGPWFHSSWASPEDGDYLGTTPVNVQLKKTVEHYLKEEMNFFRYHLKGLGSFNPSKVQFYDTGLNVWRNFDNWPIQGVNKVPLYFSKDGLLLKQSNYNNGQKGYDQFTSDPNDPVPAMEKPLTHFDPDYMIADQRFASKRDDVLTYTSEILKEDVTVVGKINADLYLSSSGSDGDWFVKIIDQFPDDYDEYKKLYSKSRKDMTGYQMLIRHDVVRGKFRNSLTRPEPLVQGEIYQIKLKMQEICHTFKKGHRIMIHIQSSMFPIYERNPQTFCNIHQAKSEDFTKSEHRLYFLNGKQSRIFLPVLK